jgi:hypothetical protein
MIKFMTRLWKDRRGNALVIAGAALPLIIGSAGLATDTIQWTLWARQMQRTADSDALAGVYGKLAGQTADVGPCSASVPVNRNHTTSNVVTRLGMTPTCNIVTPASPWNGATYRAVKVTLSASRLLPFSGFFVSTAPTITTSATAAVVSSGKYCVRALKNTTGTGITFTGNPTVNLGCGMHTNAKGSTAVDATGSPTITASPMAAVGLIAGTTNFPTSTVFQPYSPSLDDPFATQTATNPVVPNGCNQPALQGNQHSVSGSNGTFCYTSLFLNGSGDTATFTDATIIINGGNLTVNAGGVLNCTRCTFVMTNAAQGQTAAGTAPGSVSINGGATVTMIAPTSGTYKDIVIYKDRRATNTCNNCNQINGNSSSTITGAIYAPTQEVQFSGDGGLNTNCLQLVGWTVTFTGNSSINNNCPSGGPSAFDATMVRLVA